MGAEIRDLEDRVRKGERWMIYLIAAIAFFALCSVVVGYFQWSAMRGQLAEMKSGGIDTRALAQAARDQADAAQQFSHTTEGINGQMSDAVEQLSAASDNAKASIRASIAQMRLDERPWLGVVSFQCNCEETAGMVMVKGFDIDVRNSGKTPAINVSIHWVPPKEMSTPHGAAEQVPSYAEEFAKQNRFFRKFPEAEFQYDPKNGTALAPNAQAVFSFGGGIGFPRGPVNDPNRWRDAVYLLGKITYFDTFTNKEHTTGVCFVNVLGPVGSGSVPKSGNGFAMCNTSGNWMD